MPMSEVEALKNGGLDTLGVFACEAIDGRRSFVDCLQSRLHQHQSPFSLADVSRDYIPRLEHEIQLRAFFAVHQKVTSFL
jgi:hypothetical protein